METPYYPTYYLPLSDVRADTLVPTGQQKHYLSRAKPPSYREGRQRRGRRRRPALRGFTDRPAPRRRALRWAALDPGRGRQRPTHLRASATRIDILPSSRTAGVEVDGVVLPESTHPHVLFETGLPPRWYMPKVDVRLDRFTPTATTTQCPYKGGRRPVGSVSVTVSFPTSRGSYRTPLPESQRVAGLVCSATSVSTGSSTASCSRGPRPSSNQPFGQPF